MGIDKVLCAHVCMMDEQEQDEMYIYICNKALGLPAGNQGGSGGEP